MGTRLYIGNLSYDAMEYDLRALFEQAGSVVACDIMTDRHTGRSKGFAFVEMASQEDADKAIEICNGKDFEGRPLTVNEARPRAEPRLGPVPSGRRRTTAVAEAVMIRVRAAVSAENAARARGAGAGCAMKSAVARGFSSRDGSKTMMPNRGTNRSDRRLLCWLQNDAVAFRIVDSRGQKHNLLF
ncbi:MAG: RNA recognition motif domain-containing protein [Planctomycetota bacterium]|jgi:RNA recognition motif-containing protein